MSKWVSLIFLSCLLFFILPIFPVRILLCCLFITLVINRLKRIDRIFSFIFVFGLYSLAFIIPPYWNVASSPQLKLFILVFLLIASAILSFYTASIIKIDCRLRDIPSLLLLTALLYAVNYIPLHGEIPWRGDEYYHIKVILDLWQSIQSNFSGLNSSEILTTLSQEALRYPFLQRWIGLLFVFPNFYQDIALYRIVPFLSTILLSWFLTLKIREKVQSKIVSLVFSFLIVTTPLIFFYSSLLYLDMPSVLLMTICVFDIKNIITKEYEKLVTSPVWYFLLLISFLKETNLLFLLLVLVLRSSYLLYKNISLRKRILPTVIQEIKTWILLLSPVLIYLFFRHFSNYNWHSAKIDKIFDLPNYGIMVFSWLNQLGFFAILSFLGFLFLIKQRKWFILSVLSVLTVPTVWFSITDTIKYINYIGYSRWNLYLLPMFLYLTNAVVKELKTRSLIFLCFLLFASNIYLLPFHLDGVRLPNWGSPKTDTNEYTYPYEKAILWLAANKPSKSILIFGHYHWYDGFRFYGPKYHFNPKIYQYQFGIERFDARSELSMLENFFQDFSENTSFGEFAQVDTLLYHTVNNIPLDQTKIYGNRFKIVKKIENSEHSLYIFAKI